MKLAKYDSQCIELTDQNDDFDPDKIKTLAA